jgi:hypothetical protein
MAVDIKNLVAAINPKVYCKPEVRDEAVKISKEKGYLAAAEKAKIIDDTYLELDEYNDKSVIYKNPFSLPGFKAPVEKHTAYYDSFGESLEPLYFWLIDTLQSDPRMDRIDKLVDNFVAAPGSGQFSEIGQKATKMQEEAMKLLASANTVLKSIINIIYDLKEFKMRLKLYDKVKSSKPEEKNSAMISLKQIWLDTVDMKKGNTAIKAMAQQYQYVTLIDAFMAIHDLKELEKDNPKTIDLNDRVKRIIQQRFGEFQDWLEESGKELRKRFEIEKLYLKSQVNSIKIYARWAKPYLKAAQALEQNAFSGVSGKLSDREANLRTALVNSFNTSLMELVILGKGEYKLSEDIDKGDLPPMVVTAKRRIYYPMQLVELAFRSAPERTQQGGYGYRGKVDLIFTSFALNDDEIKILKEEIEKDDLNDLFRVIEGATDESLAQIETDIAELLGDKKEEESKEKKEEDTNPFSALASLFKKEEKKEEKKSDSKGPKKIEPDNDIEKVMRSQAIIKARQDCSKLYNNFKKSKGMAA